MNKIIYFNTQFHYIVWKKEIQLGFSIPLKIIHSDFLCWMFIGLNTHWFGRQVHWSLLRCSHKCSYSLRQYRPLHSHKVSLHSRQYLKWKEKSVISFRVSLIRQIKLFLWLLDFPFPLSKYKKIQMPLPLPPLTFIYYSSPHLWPMIHDPQAPYHKELWLFCNL